MTRYPEGTGLAAIVEGRGIRGGQMGWGVGRWLESYCIRGLGVGGWEGLVSCYIGRGVGEVEVGLPLYKVRSKSLWRCGSPATGLGSKAQSNKSVSRPNVL